MSNLNNNLNSDSESSDDDLSLNNNKNNNNNNYPDDSDDSLTSPKSPRVELTSVSSIDELDSPDSLKSPFNLDSPPKLKSPFKLLDKYYDNPLNYNEYFNYKNSNLNKYNNSENNELKNLENNEFKNYENNKFKNYENNEYKDNILDNDKLEDYKENNNNFVDNISKNLNLLKLADLKLKIEGLKKRIDLYKIEDNNLCKIEENNLLKAEDIILNKKNMETKDLSNCIDLNHSNSQLVKISNVKNKVRITNHISTKKYDPRKINVLHKKNLNTMIKNKSNTDYINKKISDLDVDTYSNIYNNIFTDTCISFNKDLLYTYQNTANIFLKDFQNTNGYCLVDFFNLNNKINIDGTFIVNLNDIIYLDDLFEVLYDEYFYSIKVGNDYLNYTSVNVGKNNEKDKLKYEEYNFFQITDKILNIYNKLQVLSNTGFIIVMYLDVSTFFNKHIYKFKNNMKYFKQNINNILSKYFNIVNEILLDLNKYYCRFNYLVSYQKDGFQIINCGINQILFENINSKIRYINNNMNNNNFLLGLHENVNGKNMYKNINFNATLNNNYKFLSLENFTNFVNLSNVYIGMNYYIIENTKLNNKLNITKKLQEEQKTKILKELKEYKYNLFRNYTSLITIDDLIDYTNILCVNLDEYFDKQIIENLISVYKEKYCDNAIVKTLETKIDKGDKIETKYEVTAHEVKLNIITLQVSELQEINYKNKKEEFEKNYNTFSHKKKSSKNKDLHKQLDKDLHKQLDTDKESSLKKNHEREKLKEFDIASLFYIHNNKIIKRSSNNGKSVEDIDDVEQIKKNTEKNKTINIIFYKDFTLHKCKQLFKYINTNLNLPPEEKYKIHFMNFKLNSWFRTCLAYYNYGNWFKNNNQIGMDKRYLLNKHHYNKLIHFLKKIRQETKDNNKIKMLKYSNHIDIEDPNKDDGKLIDESNLLCECCQSAILGNVFETQIKYLPYLDNETIKTMETVGDFWNIRY